MSLVCVTGANGFIGRCLVDELFRNGHKIKVLSRRSNCVFPVGVKVVSGDLTLPNCPLAEFLDGCEVLFHCAGEVRSVPAMHRLHVDGTQRLLDEVLKKSALHWVQLSSVGIYGSSCSYTNSERLITENSPQKPVGEYEVTKAKADNILVRACDGGALTWSILRPSNVLGTGMKNNSFRKLIQMVRRGLFFYIGRPGAVSNYVHVDDVVDALVKCAFEPMARGQVYNLSSDCLIEELVGSIASELGVRKPWLRVPELLVRSVVCPLEGFVNIPLTRSRIDALVSRTRYPSHKIISELDFRFSKPMPLAIKDLAFLGSSF